MKHCSRSYRERAQELKKWRPSQFEEEAMKSLVFCHLIFHISAKGQRISNETGQWESLGDLCRRPGCNQKLLLPDGSLGKRPLGFSQFLHICTSRKALPPPVSQQASSVQRPSKCHKKCSCASNSFLQNKKRNFACILYWFCYPHCTQP